MSKYHDILKISNTRKNSSPQKVNAFQIQIIYQNIILLYAGVKRKGESSRRRVGKGLLVLGRSLRGRKRRSVLMMTMMLILFLMMMMISMMII